MPRLFLRRPKVRTDERARRAAKVRIRKPKWIDPFPEVHGTLPEKMVYAELSKRGIPFYFLNDMPINIPEIELIEEFQADFIFRDFPIIIEVQGSYWHSKPDAIESDAVKMALYEMVGYRAYAWWDYDIYSRLQELISSIPELAAYPARNDFGTSELVPFKRTKIDTSQGIRTLNKKRAQQQSYKKPAVRVKGANK